MLAQFLSGLVETNREIPSFCFFFGKRGAKLDFEGFHCIGWV